MANRTFLLLFPLCAIAGFGTVVANAEQARRDPPQAAQPARISLQDARAIVRQAYGGRIVSAIAKERTIEGDVKRGYDVRVDIEGRVKTVFVDGRGRIHEQR